MVKTVTKISIVLALAGCVPDPTVSTQQSSLLRDLTPMHVVVDHLDVPPWILTEEGADDLRRRVLVELGEAGVPITEVLESTAYGGLLDFSKSPFREPTLVVSLNMVPDGSVFIASIIVTVPVLLSGRTEPVTVGAYASRSYAYLTTWRDHSPSS